MRHGYTLFLFAVLPFMGSAQTTLTLQPGPDEGQDACLHGLASEVDNNWGDIDQLAVMAWTFQSVPGVVRSALAFDLSSIPQNATITSAALSLHAYGDGPGFGGNSELSGSNAWWIERITSPWDENTVTWNTQPTTTTLHRMAVEGTDDPDHDYLDLDVTTLVQDMVLDPANSHGFLFKLQTEEYYRRLNFCASEHADPTKRPQLTVCFSVPSAVAEVAGPGSVLRAFPNPAANSITFDRGVIDGTATITVLDRAGRIVQVLSAATARTQLDVSALADGLYIARVTDGRGTAVATFVVQH